ncbi:hypothetical protein [Nafulsella turpanensis]|uniref:hypothetical protein n=1 Tax=Nafulsella turpanensis TaxID=1265690 RepID=UPI00036541CD|nr:hypothetical protein [Nafulsella turpanensis]
METVLAGKGDLRSEGDALLGYSARKDNSPVHFSSFEAFPLVLPFSWIKTCRQAGCFSFLRLLGAPCFAMTGA